MITQEVLAANRENETKTYCANSHSGVTTGGELGHHKKVKLHEEKDDKFHS